MVDTLERIEHNVAVALARLGPLVDFEFGLDRQSVERLCREYKDLHGLDQGGRS